MSLNIVPARPFPCQLPACVRPHLIPSHHLPFLCPQNQFFISCADDGKTIYNGIGDAIVNRILRAHRSGLADLLGASFVLHTHDFEPYGHKAVFHEARRVIKTCEIKHISKITNNEYISACTQPITT